MLVLTREKLLTRLLQVPALVSQYQTGDASFVPSLLAWMSSVEDDLGQLRLPVVSLCAAERGRVLAAFDGHRDGAQPVKEAGARKAIRACAALALGRVEQSLRERIAEADRQLAVAAEKLAQLLAVASSSEVVSPASSVEELHAFWSQLSKSPEARPLHRYLTASLRAGDREALLRDVLENVAGP